MSPHRVLFPGEATMCRKGGRDWVTGAKAIEKGAPHHDGGIKELWETKWRFACMKSVYPFHEGQYEDFEPIFDHLIKNGINDASSVKYTSAFLAAAESLAQQAETQLDLNNQPKKASALYLRACALLRIARLPRATSNPGTSCPVKRQARELQKKLYLRAGRTWDLPVEEAVIPHIRRDPRSGDGARVPIYVRIPEITAREGEICPVVVLVTGSRPDHTQKADEFLARGWGVVVVDVPGSADCPADSSDPESADRLWSSLLDWMEAVRFFDMKRVMVWEVDAGGYYAVRMAHTHRERVLGCIAEGAGVHGLLDECVAFADGYEYPPECTPDMAAQRGYETAEACKEGAQKVSLLESGILHEPSCRLLLVNGRTDGMVSVEDSLMLFEYGSPKKGRFFNGAVRKGYPVADTSVYPWMESVMKSVCDEERL